jgi:hypothetical protein
VAQCSRRDCTRPAVREVRWEQPWPTPHDEPQIIGVELCEAHATEQEAKRCERHGCPRLAAVVIGLDGQDYATGAARQEELQMCTQCWEAVQHAPSVTINGVRMVHDGSGRMKALPPEIGRG